MIDKYLQLSTSPCINRYFNDFQNLFFFIFILILSLSFIKIIQLKYESNNLRNKLLFKKIKFSSFEPKLIYFIFFYHLFFTIINIFFADCDEMTSPFPVVPNDANSIYINAGYWFHETKFSLGSNFLSYILYPLVSIFKISFLNVNLIFSLLGLFGILLFYTITKQKIYKLNSNLYLFLIILTILPNFHYWTSYLTKETLIFFFLSLYLFYSFSEEEKFKIKYFLIFLFLICLSVRPYFGLIFIISHLVALFLLEIIKKKISLKIFAVLIIINIFAYFALVSIYWKFDYTGIADIPSNIINFLNLRFGTTMIGSSFNEHHGYFTHFLIYFFSPLELPSNLNLKTISVFFNNFILITIFTILVSHLVFNLRYLNKAFKLVFNNEKKKIFRISLLIFLIFFTFLLGNSTANFGIIMRHKESFMFIMFFYLIYINSNILLIKNK